MSHTKFELADTRPALDITVIPNFTTEDSFSATFEPPLPDGGVGLCRALNQERRGEGSETFSYATNAFPVHSDEAGTTIVFDYEINPHESGDHVTRMRNAAHRAGSIMCYLIDPNEKRNVQHDVATKPTPRY